MFNLTTFSGNVNYHFSYASIIKGFDGNVALPCMRVGGYIGGYYQLPLSLRCNRGYGARRCSLYYTLGGVRGGVYDIVSIVPSHPLMG